MGKAGIPSIGFGPGDEAYAHSVMEQISLREVVDATGYRLLPAVLQGWFADDCKREVTGDGSVVLFTGPVKRQKVQITQDQD
jgi:hypothetical protein